MVNKSKNYRYKLTTKYKLRKKFSLRRDAPFLKGNAIGLVLHQKRGGRWRIVNILKKSPAEKTRIQIGDYLESIDKYSTKELDFAGIFLLIRPGKPSIHRLGLSSKNKIFKINAAPTSLQRIMKYNIDTSICNKCRTCVPTAWGWGICKPRCRWRCGVA